MATPRMEKRINERKSTENFVEGFHLKLKDLRDAAKDADLKNQYLFKSIIPYPQPEFHVSRLKHDTNLAGLRGIRRTGCFTNPFRDSAVVWFRLDVGPEEIEEAERRLLETTYPDRTQEQVQNQQNFLEMFASSPAFLRSSRYGSYRFTFSVEEVLEAYKHQFCSGADPVMRVMKTILYKQEVVYVVLIHSPTNQDEFSGYPLLSENPDPVCTFTEGRFIWTSQAMCESHRYMLVQNNVEKKMEVRGTGPYPEWFVWDNVAIALHVGDEFQGLKFNASKLREKLTFCEEGDVKLTFFQDFTTATKIVADLWPGYPRPLIRDEKITEEVPMEVQFPAEAEDDLC